MTVSPTVAAAVITRVSRVLLIRRTAPAGSLLWTFPSGKVEPGETAAEAAAREAHEEAGVTVGPLVVLGSRVHPVTGWRVVYVACRLLLGTAHAASPREVAEVAWVPAGRLAEYVPGGVYPPVRGYLDASALRHPQVGKSSTIRGIRVARPVPVVHAVGPMRHTDVVDAVWGDER